MDPRRKKIYIILIVVCLILSAALLAYNFFGSGSAPVVIPGNAQPTSTLPAGTVSQTPGAAAGDSTNGFQAPAVFPSTDAFDTEALNSPDFKNLVDYTPLSTTGQIGRDNPFKNY